MAAATATKTAMDSNGEEAVAKIKAYEASSPFLSPLPPLPGQRCTPNGAEGRQQAAGVASRASDGVAGAVDNRAVPDNYAHLRRCSIRQKIVLGMWCLKGGKARFEKLIPEQRKEIAIKGAQAQ